MWHITKILRASAFTFGEYKVDTRLSTIIFTYHVKFKFGITKTFTDRLIFSDIKPEMWKNIPKEVLEQTLQALLLIVGINYWQAFPTKNIFIKGFALTHEQARFWDSLYLNGLGEFFYLMKIDFRNLIAFPYDASIAKPEPVRFKRPTRSLLLNGAGKDSILSAEMLKATTYRLIFSLLLRRPHTNVLQSLLGQRQSM